MYTNNDAFALQAASLKVFSPGQARSLRAALGMYVHLFTSTVSAEGSSYALTVLNRSHQVTQGGAQRTRLLLKLSTFRPSVWLVHFL